MRRVVVLVARYRARPGRGDAVAEAMREMIPRSREEPGCLAYLVQRSQSEPDEFVLYEQYVDEAAIDAHRATPHFQEIVLAQVIPLLESREWGLYAPLE